LPDTRGRCAESDNKDNDYDHDDNNDNDYTHHDDNDNDCNHHDYDDNDDNNHDNDNSVEPFRALTRLDLGLLH